MIGRLNPGFLSSGLALVLSGTSCSGAPPKKDAFVLVPENPACSDGFQRACRPDGSAVLSDSSGAFLSLGREAELETVRWRLVTSLEVPEKMVDGWLLKKKIPLEELAKATALDGYFSQKTLQALAEIMLNPKDKADDSLERFTSRLEFFLLLLEDLSRYAGDIYDAEDDGLSAYPARARIFRDKRFHAFRDDNAQPDTFQNSVYWYVPAFLDVVSGDIIAWAQHPERDPAVRKLAPSEVPGSHPQRNYFDWKLDMAVFNLEFRNSLFKEPFGNADGVRLSAWKHEPHPTSRDVTSNHGWWLTLPRIDGGLFVVRSQIFNSRLGTDGDPHVMSVVLKDTTMSMSAVLKRILKDKGASTHRVPEYSLESIVDDRGLNAVSL